MLVSDLEGIDWGAVMEWMTHRLWVPRMWCLVRNIVCIIFCLALTIGQLDARHRRHKYRQNRHRMREIPSVPVQPFAKTLSKFFDESSFSHYHGQAPYEYIWTVDKTHEFNELIFSWNALRPESGNMTFWVSINYPQQSSWHRIAEWGPDYQKTFINKRHPYVHTKHVRVEMQKHKLANGFRIKVIFSNGASPHQLKALFACISNTKLFRISVPNLSSLKDIHPLNVPKQSQRVIDHPRALELCSPTSTSMLVHYFINKMNHSSLRCSMHDYVIDFADKVHDDSNLNIYGNWILNVAQAFDSSNGGVFFRVERLNNFTALHDYLTKRIPVAVSVRRLRGGAMPYRNGHFMVVVGWDALQKLVTCIDPAFEGNGNTLRHYRLRDFLQAWARSTNLSYVPIPTRYVWNLLWHASST